MKIDGLELEYFIDYTNKAVHLLSRSRASYQEVLNAISEDFKRRLIEQEQLLIDIFDFDWICYSMTGLIMEYKDYGLLFVSKSDKRLYKPYMSVLEA